MLIGAPGVYNWTGTVIRINDANSKFDNTFVANTAKIAKLQPNDYFGIYRTSLLITTKLPTMNDVCIFLLVARLLNSLRYVLQGP